MKYGELLIMLVIGVVALACIFAIVHFTIEENQKYIYECTDYKGDIIYCTDAYIYKGGMFGTREDGTKTTITTYRQILKEERNKQYEQR